MEIQSERLRLRQWRDSDLHEYARFFSDPEQARFVGGVCNDYEAWRRMAVVAGHWSLKGFGLWAVETLADAHFVGCVGIQRPQGWPESELGYWIAAAEQHRGYATEAALRARRFAYEELRLATLVSYIDPANRPSIRVAERLGATLEKTIELLDFGPHLVYRHPPPATAAGGSTPVA